jgi:hypothetical protein
MISTLTTSAMTLSGSGGIDESVVFGTLAALVLISVVLGGLWLWSLIHCVLNKRLEDNTRLIGILLIVLLGILGSLIYLFLPRRPE